ncbi:MAG: class I SAM-dependent methyltransferase [Verrucomicrobiales bacterium]
MHRRGDLPRLICQLAEARLRGRHRCGGLPARHRRDRPAALRGASQINVIEADVLRFEPEPRGYDFALCCLALHHFSEADAARILVKLRGAARVAALARRPAPRRAHHLRRLADHRRRLSRPDDEGGRCASAARAFSFGEFAALAGEAGWSGAAHRRRYFGRQELALDCASDSAP